MRRTCWPFIYLPDGALLCPPNVSNSRAHLNSPPDLRAISNIFVSQVLEGDNINCACSVLAFFDAVQTLIIIIPVEIENYYTRRTHFLLRTEISKAQLNDDRI